MMSASRSMLNDCLRWLLPILDFCLISPIFRLPSSISRAPSFVFHLSSFIYHLLSSAFCFLPSTSYLLPSAFRLLPFAFCIPFSVFRLLSSIFRFQSSNFCFLIAVFRFFSWSFSLLYSQTHAFTQYHRTLLMTHRASAMACYSSSIFTGNYCLRRLSSVFKYRHDGVYYPGFFRSLSQSYQSPSFLLPSSSLLCYRCTMLLVHQTSTLQCGPLSSQAIGIIGHWVSTLGHQSLYPRMGPYLSVIYILFGVYIYRLSIFVWSLCFIGCLYFVWSPNLMGLYLLDPYLLAAHVYWCLCFVSRLKFVIVSMFYQMMRVIFVIVIMITLDVAILVFSVLSQLVRCPHHQQSNDSTRYYVFVIFGCIYCFCFSRCLL